MTCEISNECVNHVHFVSNIIFFHELVNFLFFFYNSKN